MSNLIRTIGIALTLIALGAPWANADIAIYTVKDFQSITARANEPYQITGFAVDIAVCPPCPEDAVCETCLGEYIIIADSPSTAGEENAGREFKIFLNGPAADLKPGVRYLFHLKYLGSDRPVLTGFEEFSGEDAQDLTVKVKETVCADDVHTENCKPRIMNAIETGDFGLVKEIVENGADVNTAYPYYYGKTALMHAIQEGESGIALYLLEKGTDPNVVAPLDPLPAAESGGLTDVAAKIRALRERTKDQ